MCRWALTCFLFGVISSSSSSLSSPIFSTVPDNNRPIVYTIAGSDSGGGAGIQADLHAIQNMLCHGCSAITCLTAQNSVGVTGVHTPPESFLRQQLDTLTSDMSPRAIKIGMLGKKELTIVVSDVLREIKAKDSNVFVVLDPVMISTSGSKLIDDDAIEAMVKNVFPLADIVTPNKFEAEALLGRKLLSPEDIEKGARELLEMGCNAVLIKGGHSLLENSSSKDGRTKVSLDVDKTFGFAQDYLLTSEDIPAEKDQRLCDGANGVWIRTKRWDSDNTHGTGCTLSSSIAAAFALGAEKRIGSSTSPEGATSAIGIVDACCLAKAYVSAGIQHGIQFGKGPGPVAQTEFPSSWENFPCIVADPNCDPDTFLPMKPYSMLSEADGTEIMGRTLPIVDTVDWVEKLANTPGVTDIQLRIKDETDPQKIIDRAIKCEQMCKKNGVRLWINDHWEAAVAAGCFGVHIGQEDLAACMKSGGLDKIREKDIALGISTHSYAELSAAIGVKPSYISLGPVFATSSKKVKFDPQGLGIVSKWRQLIPPEIPLVTIGGIGDTEAAKQNRQAGSDCVAVIGAVTTAEDVAKIIADLNEAMN